MMVSLECQFVMLLSFDFTIFRSGFNIKAKRRPFCDINNTPTAWKILVKGSVVGVKLQCEGFV